MGENRLWYSLFLCYWFNFTTTYYGKLKDTRHFLKDFVYLFLERGERREKEREININAWLPLTCPLLGTWLASWACDITGNRTDDPLVCRPALKPLSHTSQGTRCFDDILKIIIRVIPHEVFTFSFCGKLYYVE